MNLYNAKYKITSSYGKRTLNGINQIHNGIDFVGLVTKNIYSPINGVVKTSTIITNKNDLTWQWGNYIKIVDNKGYSYFFCHLSDRKVKVGDKVVIGTLIGVEGNTGYSFGSHCHFEVKDRLNITIDPQTIFKNNVFKIGTYNNDTKLKVGDKVNPNFGFIINKIYSKNGKQYADISTNTGKCKITCQAENLRKK